MCCKMQIMKKQLKRCWKMKLKLELWWIIGISDAKGLFGNPHSKGCDTMRSRVSHHDLAQMK